MLLKYTIQGTPTPWTAHQGSGRRSYNPRSKERKNFQLQLLAQGIPDVPLQFPMDITFCFYLKIPPSLRNVHSGTPHVKKPDVTNLQKFAEDCLKGIVIKDDNSIIAIHSSKFYSDNPRTEIKIKVLM